MEEWEVCIAKLEEAIQYLQDCKERLEKVLKDVDELRGIE